MRVGRAVGIALLGIALVLPLAADASTDPALPTDPVMAEQALLDLINVDRAAFGEVAPLLEEFNSLYVRVCEHNHGSPGYARTLRRLLHEAGFARTEVQPVLPPMPPSVYARQFANLLQIIAETIVAQGWADSSRLDAIAAALAAWGERPDAQILFVVNRVIGWVDHSRVQGGGGLPEDGVAGYDKCGAPSQVPPRLARQMRATATQHEQIRH